MARERSELAQRRGQLTRSLPGLSETRARHLSPQQPPLAEHAPPGECFARHAQSG